MRFPSIKVVATELRAINAEDAGDPEYGCDEASIDVRLQVYPCGDWAVRWGDSQYDQDHRGYWGSSGVPGNGRRFHSFDVARDLIEQCRDAYAEDVSASNALESSQA